MNVTLLPHEVSDLFADPQPTGGGFQSLVSKLQDNCNQKTGDIYLDADCLERIPRYAFDYDQGGWEDQLIRIFSRTLGSKLGR
ncbi:hypothetical protein GCM10023213_49100 [Prosthecobacter algae]|uniref:Uncharacterized protein n=1 Tax=Prosthecobacter algae TaxID=1144682 RepID=A0ABP9PQG2_9BACT